MNKKSLNIEFLEYDTVNELDVDLLGIIRESEENLKSAYAPYSNFKVSAICKMSNGDTVVGTNQENAAYPSGLCAERVAVFAAKSKYPDQKIDMIILTTEESNPIPFSPCGACRQVLMEYEMNQKQPIRVVLKSGNSKIWEFKSIKNLLPFAFDASTILKKG